MQELRLHVNVDHVATLRQARRTQYPDPVFAAYLCESVGAAGITVHLREDRRHIQERDVYLLRESVQGILNLEMGASPELVAFACELRPNLVTLVPERREELTTEGGLDVVGLGENLQKSIDTLQNAGVPVSLFVAPDSAQVEASHRAGVRGIELHTGHYCEVKGTERQQELARLAAASKQAAALGLEVAAGHGLTCENVAPICHLPEVIELNIGHGIVSRAVFVGMERAVQEMLAVMRRERHHIR